MTITAVSPRSARREMSTNRPQHSRPVDRVERVGNVNRKCNFARIRMVTVEPLAGRVHDRLPPVRCLDHKLKRLHNDSRVLREIIYGNLACKTADNLAHSDRPEGTFGLAKSHDGSSANVGTYHLGNLTPEHDADHPGEKPQEQIRGMQVAEAS